MRKFKRIYHAVLILAVISLLTVSKQIGAINFGLQQVATSEIDTVPAGNNIPPAIDTIPSDTIPVIKDSLSLADSTLIDTTQRARSDTFTLKISKDTLSAPVTYTAADSAIGLVQNKTIELYGKAKTEYESSSLEAPYLKLNQATGIVSAVSGRDSTGAISEYVKMNDGQSEYQSDSLNYNFKNQRGIISGTISQQGEMFVHSQLSKKVNENTVYATGNFFTTCNLDHPHFGFRANRAKIVNKKLAVTGAVRPEFDSVPVPIYLPFGFYPLYQGRHSGFMAPSFETNDQEGVGLSQFGYYLGISDYWDVQFYGDIYSGGTWRLNANPTYRKIYKYQGNLNFSIQSTRRNTKGDPDFYKSNTYALSWSHSSDSRSRPGVTFGANVNWSTTGYNRNLSNSFMGQAPYNNVMSSSITYSKQWIDKPFNLTLAMNHSQNNSTHLMTINFPTANFAVTTLYPFQKKESVGSSRKWYEQLGIGYTGSFRNDFNFYDTLAYSKSNNLIDNRRIYNFLLDTARWSANHNIPITLSLPAIAGGALVIAPSVSYSQEWVDGISTMTWGPRTFYTGAVNGGDSSYVKDTINVSLERGFNIKQQASFGISFNTALYGNYQFKGEKVKALRHVIRPQFGLNYTPDLTKNYWKTVQIDTLGTKALYNQLDGLYSRPVTQFTSRRSGGINFGIDNNLEMKVKAKPKKKKDEGEEDDENEEFDNTLDTYANTSKEDAEDGIKKIKLIDGFGFNGSYNFLAEEMKLSPINMYFRSNLFEKINLNASATLVPYKLNDYGYATPIYAWAEGGKKIGTITNANISMSTSFQSKPKDPEKAKAREKAINERLNDPMLMDEQQRLMEYARQNPAEFVDFNTPWSISLSYSLTYSRKGRNLNTLQSSVSPVTSSVNFNGSFNLTPKWNFSVNGYYDFTTSQIQTFSMAISRDLHCWQMAINVTPIGLYRFFNFTISPKAGILQDLKINRTRSFVTNPR
ncbi:putative LPS assembly protein LptD [Niabella insulamsoli]|uniref:putative LPS assembly protein LptD n=1 Tax=Niabella insulamsoli TaxID=3144874 RepID=UPI0031FDBD34